MHLIYTTHINVVAVVVGVPFPLVSYKKVLFRQRTRAVKFMNHYGTCIYYDTSL